MTLMPLFLQAKSAEEPKTKLLAFQANFPTAEDVGRKKEQVKKEGKYSFMLWRKFLISNNTYMMHYSFNRYQALTTILSFNILYVAWFTQPYLLLKLLGTVYPVIMVSNNMIERHFRNLMIDKIYLVLPTEEVQETPKGGFKVPITVKELDIHLVNGKVLQGVKIDTLKLLEQPSKQPDLGLIGKIKGTLKEMYMNEYYEILQGNFVMQEKGPQLYMVYHEKSKMEVCAYNIERKLLEAALNGTEIDAVNFS